MPHRATFKVPPLLSIVLRYKQSDRWIDPFSGWHSPAEVTNDLNPNAPSDEHMEAADYLATFRQSKFAGAIFDPPYSLTQVSRSYRDIGLQFKGKENPTGGFPKVRDELARIIRPSGVCVSFGWNTAGLGKTRGFEIIEILICAHGGNRNDTLVTVERKL